MDDVTAGTDAGFPFEHHHLELGDGRMYYVDEGGGRPVVLVHGTPTSSYLYRHLIPGLAERNRVIAVDHLGFGRSDKPGDADYRPAALARNLEMLIEQLGLQDLVLVVHDFGGPIGLHYAIEHPANVAGLVLFNTWMWSLEGTSTARLSRLLSGRLGRLLYTRLNFSPRVLLKAGFADRSKLSREAHRHYMDAFPTPDRRTAPWVFARELAGSGPWYQELWDRRERIAHKPALLLWGMKDPAFGPEALERWKQALGNARAVELAGVGHFVQEEAGDAALEHMRAFLAGLDEAAGDD